MRAELDNIIKNITKSMKTLEKKIGWNDLASRFDELSAIIEMPNLWNNPQRAQKLMKERQTIEDFKSFHANVTLKTQENVELIELAELEDDLVIIKELQEELMVLQKLILRKEIEALLSEEMDGNDTFLEINSGAGGTESCDWTAMLARMYVRWAEKQGYLVELISQNPGEEAGLKSITYKVKGLNAFGWLKTETGVHRLVRISPFDSSARRHTSFSAVWIYPVIDENINVELNSSELRVDTFRSSGAGGQHVNTTDSAVRITHLPTGIVVTSSEKSQHQNRANCMAAIKSKLYELEMKAKNKTIQEAHDSKGEAGWGNQIRSYVLQPYQLVKDLRTSVETSDSQGVLDGDLEKFLTASLSS